MKRSQILYVTLICLALLAVPITVALAGDVHPRTSPLAQTGSTTFAVIGDYGVDDSNEQAVANLVAGWNPNFVVTTGDDFYSAAIDAGDTGNKYHESTGKYYCAYLRDVAGAGTCATGSAATNRFFPSAGNHDWSDAGPNSWNTYVNYFTLPGAGIASSNTSGNERYYDFVQGPVHFFVLNSDPNEPNLSTSSAAAAMASTMGQWLQARLAASTSTWNVVVFHHPPYSSGSSHGSTAWMQWDFAGWGADAVLSGHEHDYERIVRDGIVYFVNGLGGASRYSFGTPVTGSEARYNGNWGAMRVTATDTTMYFEFISVDNVVRDTYLLSQGPTPTSTHTPTPPPNGILNLRITQGADDIEQRTTDGAMYLDSTDLELVDDLSYWGLQNVGLRFTGVNVPPGATITSAYIEFETDETSSEATSLTLRGEASDNAAVFTTAAYNLTSRPQTTAQVAWNAIPAWNTVDQKQQTPGLAAIVQEIVNRPGWAANNALAFVISGSGRRVAEAVEGEPAAAALLHIEYTAQPPPPTATPTFTPVPPTATPTPTSIPPTSTPTPAPPTATPTFTPVPPTSTPTPTPTPAGSYVIYLSSTTNGSSGGVAFNDEDVLSYTAATGAYAMVFDGSDVGIAGDVDAFALQPDGSLLLSFDASVSISGLGSVADADIVRFTPTSLGANTAGSFSWYFDGSDVALTKSSEDIDAFATTPDGKLVISTIGAVSVAGASGDDEDLLVFTPTQLGATTSGTWSLYFDGSDVGLSNSTSEQIYGAWIDPITGEIYLTTAGTFSVPAVSGDGADVFICTPGSLGSNTACTYRMYWDGSAKGFTGEVMDALEIVK